MGQRGPARTPTSILKLRGSWRAKMRGDEPAPDQRAPECPEWLSAEERAVWERVTALLAEMRLLTVADGAQLERYCRYSVRWRQCERIMAKFTTDDMLVGGLTNEGMRPVIRNAWTESHRLAAELRRIEAQFGLTPAARASLNVIPKPEKPVSARRRA